MYSVLQRVILLGLFYSGTIAAADSDLQPRIPPGYQPLDQETEQGLWMELDEYEASIRRSALLITDEPINRYVQGAACRVTGDYCKDLRIYIVRNPGFNASMAANGVMLIWTGLLVRVSSEDELAAVLGHELAHYTQLHTVERFKKVKSSLAASSVIDLFLGIPLASMTSIAGIMSFSREQETEADLLGVKFMADSGYDPSAAARVWEMIVEEEQSAVAKREEPGLFSRTHPAAEDRIEILKAFVEQNYQEASQVEPSRASHVEILNRYYLMLMEDQIDTNRFGRTENILMRHREIGVKSSLIDFFHGEMYRQRNAEGDIDLARKSYELAILDDEPVVEAYRNLGYINLKQGDRTEAGKNFRQYLDLYPDADDREMIEFYLEE